jgi:hypothetical protein
MAYMDQQRKAQLAPAIKAALNKYKVKATIGVRNHMSLVVNIRSGQLDFIGNYNAVMQDKQAQQVKDCLTINPYWYREHFTGDAVAFFNELFAAMNAGNHDRSDIMTDYFDVGWYVDVNIGNWQKPYQLETA